MQRRKTYCFDIDGTICTNTFGEYEKAKPFIKRINIINKLFNEGNIIKFLTARGSSTGIDWKDLTQKQLDDWGVKYNTLDLGKLDADVFIDDKGLNAEFFFNNLNDEYIKDHIDGLLKTFTEGFREKIHIISKHIIEAFENDCKLIMACNGGSFSDCLHISSNLTNNHNGFSKALPLILLGSDCSLKSSISNSYEDEKNFSRELSSISRKGDIFIGISKSGKSQNILNCFEDAKKNGLYTIFLTSEKYCQNLLEVDMELKVESSITSIIKEIHLMIMHLICKSINESFHSN